jgi:hypothetical protein
MSRDDFSSAVKDVLSKRVALRCSNPSCRLPTFGPHSAPAKAVNLGVAAHITAAAAGGPRFDPALSSEARSSIENAIWLCQGCAKLVDSDAGRFSASQLLAWKAQAEVNARSELEVRSMPANVQVGRCQTHSPLPPMMGMTYHEARRRLIENGWQPRMRHWSHGSHYEVVAAAELWKRGYREIINAWGTGEGQITFAFHDVYGNFLTVQTHGEEDPGENYHACVTNWYFTDIDSVPLKAAG